MLLRFIVDSSDFLKVLSGRENENFAILRRDDGFFKNKAFIQTFGNNLDADIIIYTDDETMLNYAPYISASYASGKYLYLIEFKFPESEEFIPIMKLHPNLRRENNLMVMYHKGIFHRDFEALLEENK